MTIGWPKIKTIVLWLVLSAVTSGLTSFAYAVGILCDRLDALNSAIERNDAVSARKALDQVKSFYGQANKIHLGWAFVAMTEEPRLFSGAYLYLVGNYEAASKEVEGIDDYRAFHISGIAKFRFAQTAYLSGQKRKALDFVANQVVPDFEKAVRLGPDSNFDDKWNYDLLSDDGAAAKALKNTGGAPKLKLGYENPGSGAQPEPDEGGGIDNQKKGGSGQKRRG